MGCFFMQAKKKGDRGKNYYIYGMIVSFLFCALIVYFLWQKQSQWYIFLPFLICGMASFMYQAITFFFELRKNQDSVDIMRVWTWKRICSRIYIGTFFLFWFGCLVVFDLSALQSGDYILFLFSIPFWLIGMYSIWKSWKSGK